jgi:hypothetical protein
MRSGPSRFVLYPRNDSTTGLDLKLFRRPTAEYRGTPFWSWNAKLDVEQLLRQIEQLKAMGFGGFHMHARTGLATEYLGDEFMAAVVACTKKAAKERMLAWLYDEDRWPSGFAGGLVTRDPEHRAKHLLWTLTPYRGLVDPACQDERAAGTRSENGVLLARYEVVLEKGRLAHYRRLRDGEKTSKKARARVWYAYLESSQPSSWFNHQTYVDTFSKAAIERFIETTHERYASAVGKLFGKVVPAIFTDEPQFPKKTTFMKATDERDVIMPFTGDFVETYKATYRQDLLEHLPEIFWNLTRDAVSLVRYRYHDHTAERFASAYGDTLGAWCDAHGIALTGHMLGEPNLYSQTRAVGEAMRPLRSFQLPGIDMLCDRHEYTTAKQAQSVAHQFDRPGVMSELYGVTNWDFDFVGHKAQGDWQAALGVTVRVPHLAWVSMAGESKRDYPAAIGYQSPWFREYPLIEDHFARVNTVMTRGKPLVRVGVIHPVESYWLSWGPVEHVQPEWEERERQFGEIVEWLLFGLIDFDFISEGILAGQKGASSNGIAHFAVGAMKYDVVVAPNLRTIRGSTLKRLEQFVRAGGTVIFAGDVPTLVDAKRSRAPGRLAKRAQVVPFSRTRILAALEPFREIEIRHEDGSPADSILHQIRVEGKQRHLFLCNTDRERGRHKTSIRLRGKWSTTMLETMTGESSVIASQVEGGATVIPWNFAAHAHLLLTLRSGRALREVNAAVPTAAKRDVGMVADPVPITLTEPNVLLLDQAQWRLDEGEWEPLEEILRLDNLAREKLKLHMRAGRIAQPWTDREPAPVVGQLQLRFVIRSEVVVNEPLLALENAEQTEIQLDGKGVGSQISGRWVDEAIKTVKLPSFKAGEHELIVTIPFTRKTDVEWCYLLGDFGVRVAGRHATITAPARELSFGDWTHQGLPFYAGNVTYHCTIEGSGAETVVQTPKFRNPLLSVELDGSPAGKIAFAPFEVSLEGWRAGSIGSTSRRMGIVSTHLARCTMRTRS